MTWSRFDDGYDEHGKVEEAWALAPEAVGLHVMATTACNRWLSDGVIRPRWLAAKLPNRTRRAAVLEMMVRVGLFDLLPAGQKCEVTDSEGEVVVLGPFDEDRYVVHDFLDRHDSARRVKERRASDARRKRAARARADGAATAPPEGDVQPESARTPAGLHADRAQAGAWAGARIPTRPSPTTPPQPPASGGSGSQRGARRRRRKPRERSAAEVAAHAASLSEHLAQAPEPDDRWLAVRERLERAVEPAAFERWLAPLHFHALDEECLIIGAPDEDRRAWIATRFAKPLALCVADVLGPDVTIDLEPCVPIAVRA